MLVTCDWGVNALGAAARDAVIVVVDVFSFSTAVTVACSRGARIIPCAGDGEAAAALARAEGAELASKDRRSAFSLSPAALRGIPPGARMVLPSRNGSTIAAAAREAGFGVIAAGCLRNAAAVAAWIGERPAAIIAGGERWGDDSLRFALEDWLAAGAIVARLPHRRSPEAEVAEAAFARLRPGLAAALRDTISGRELIDAGWGDDVGVATDLDADVCVPVLEGNAFTLARS
jgi:2-phosphosulfolactate phosphatase